MGAKFRKPPSRVAMDYIHYTPCFERGDDEGGRRRKRLEHALTELGFVVGQLRRITDRLMEVGSEDLTEETVSWFVQELGYHGEYFLSIAYEVQDRLAGILAVLSGLDKRDLIGRERAYQDKRMPLYVRMQETMPEAARHFLFIESCVCSFVRLRRLKTHEATLHFEFMIDGDPCDPAEILTCVKDEALFGELVQMMRQEAHGFISRHEDACKRIENAADKLDEAVRQAEKLDA